MEFNVDTTVLEQINALEIKSNYEELKTQLTEACKPYLNMVVTADGIGAAKSDRAKLNKISKSIDDYRKKIKKMINEPYEVFKTKCDELVAICAAASKNIDTQVKEYEERSKDDKIALLKGWFESKGLPDYITWDFIYRGNEKWRNASCSIETCQTEIDLEISHTETAHRTIETLYGNFAESVFKKYIDTKDFNMALSFGDDVMKAAAPKEMPKAKEEPKPAIDENADSKDEEREYHLIIYGTNADYRKVIRFLEQNGIKNADG